VPELKRAIVRIVIKGTPIQFRDGLRPEGKHHGQIIKPKIWKLVKSGCLTIVPSRPPEEALLVDITPSGLVQALCSGSLDRVSQSFQASQGEVAESGALLG
jgi:hypothetical protein